MVFDKVFFPKTGKMFQWLSRTEQNCYPLCLLIWRGLHLPLSPLCHSFINKLLSVESFTLCCFNDPSVTTHYPRSKEDIQASVLLGVSAQNSGRTSIYVATKTTGFARISSSWNLNTSLTFIAQHPQ